MFVVVSELMILFFLLRQYNFKFMETNTLKRKQHNISIV